LSRHARPGSGVFSGLATAALVLVYFTIVTGVGLVLRLIGRNGLKHRPRQGGFWQEHRGGADRASMERER